MRRPGREPSPEVLGLRGEQAGGPGMRPWLPRPRLEQADGSGGCPGRGDLGA